MIFKDWTYRKKNWALLVAGIVVLLLCWYLAFGKTYRLITGYWQLRDGMSTVGPGDNIGRLRERLSKQDTLLVRYEADSTQWVSGLLAEVGSILDRKPIGVSFENKPLGSADAVVERELTLKGPFSVLQEALQALEQHFFVKSIRAEMEKEQLVYRIRLAAIKVKQE